MTHSTRLFRALLGLLAACALWLAGAQNAHAQDVVCSKFTMPGAVAFGSFTPFDAAPTTSGQLSFECYNTNSAIFGIGNSIYAAVCFNFGPGSAGTSITPRSMTTTASPAADALQYQLYSSANTPWGTRSVSGSRAAEVVLELPVKWLILGDYVRKTGAVNYSAAITSGQTTAVPGSYQSNFSGTSAEIVVVTGSSSSVTCQGVGASSSNVSFTPKSLSFSVTAKVLPICHLDTSGANMNFASIDPLASGPFDASSSLRTRCTNKTSYQIAMEPGGTPTPANGAGVLKSSSTVTGDPDTYLNYSLYRDAARTLPWGNIQNTNTMSRQGTGDYESAIPIYGRIASGNVRPGSYSDTVVVKVIY